MALDLRLAVEKISGGTLNKPEDFRVMIISTNVSLPYTKKLFPMAIFILPGQNSLPLLKLIFSFLFRIMKINVSNT